MPRIKPERRAERREQILAAARAVFARLGFHRATLQDVFVEAGLSAGCVYGYFRSKDELILAIADARHAEDRDAIASGAATDPFDALQQIVGRFIEIYLGDAAEEKRRIAIQTWSQAMLDPAVLASVREGFERPRKEIAALVARGQDLGEFARDLDPDGVARTIVALFHGALLQKLWEPANDIAPSLRVFERFLAALRSKPQRE
ncbi:MAG: TetR/AcrR family transcriptional regulator [Alphaproteobacteria bacterium]